MMLSKMSRTADLRYMKGRLATTISASEAKSIGHLLDAAEKGKTVAITRYGQVKAVVVPIERYRMLTEAEPQLSQLEQDFEAMLARMQSPQAQDAVEAVFRASPTELGEAALAAAGKRTAGRIGA
jgi:antitoxin Phd